MTERDMKRLESNRKIVARLSELVEKNPSWRFHQIMMNFNLEAQGEDRWYEESEKTWQNFDNATKVVVNGWK